MRGGSATFPWPTAGHHRRRALVRASPRPAFGPTGPDRPPDRVTLRPSATSCLRTRCGAIRSAAIRSQLGWQVRDRARHTRRTPRRPRPRRPPMADLEPQPDPNPSIQAVRRWAARSWSGSVTANVELRTLGRHGHVIAADRRGRAVASVDGCRVAIAQPCDGNAAVSVDRRGIPIAV
jgi:hypothetical protein